ncbi:MAG: hypothetical protein K5761_00280 [Clostridiales bacterium]|nr:hypothetical protein [Clostridiales bacterium]
MQEKNFDSMERLDQAPSDFIDLMFERTDEDGILYIPGWAYARPGWEYNVPGSDDAEGSYRCRIDWNLDKLEKVQEKFEDVYYAITRIVPYYDELEENPGRSEEILKDPTLINVWKKYLEEPDTGRFDRKKYDEIYEKLDTIAEVKCIAEKLAKGNAIDDNEKEILTDYMDLTVSEEELKYRQDFLRHMHREAEKRLGKNICAYDLITRAWRVLCLMAINAPDLILTNELKQFAAAFVLHEYGMSKEPVDNTVRLRLEQMELMSDEELDDYYRPQKTNTRKSLAPLFIFEILTKYSDINTHLRQNEIIKKLAEYPYEISLERKALSRIIHNLTDSPNYAVFQDKTGVWMEQEKTV